MSYEYSENVFVQGCAGNLLHDELGWDVVMAYNQETLGTSGTLDRTTYRDVVLTRYLERGQLRYSVEYNRSPIRTKTRCWATARDSGRMSWFRGDSTELCRCPTFSY